MCYCECCFPLFKVLGIFGLALDVIGVIGLFRFGFPNVRYMKFGKKGVKPKIVGIPKDEKSTYIKTKLLGEISILLIVIGFILQAIAIFVQ